MDIQYPRIWQREKNRPAYPTLGGQNEAAKQTPYWIVVVLEKTALIETEGGLRLYAEAVLLPHILMLPGNSLLREQASKQSQPTIETRKAVPCSKLVQSYHRESACQRLQTSGPPWLVKQTQSNPTRTATCLYTPAWEQKHRPLEGVKCSLVKCNKAQQDQASCRNLVSERAKVARRQYCEAKDTEQGAFDHDSPATNSSLVGPNRPNRAKVSEEKPSARPLCGQKEDLNRFRKRAALVPCLRRRIIGAAAAVRLKKLGQQNRPEVEIAGVDQRIECTVYRQRVGTNERVERGAGIGGHLVVSATDSNARVKREATGQQRVVLTFSGEAAQAFEVRESFLFVRAFSL